MRFLRSSSLRYRSSTRSHRSALTAAFLSLLLWSVAGADNVDLTWPLLRGGVEVVGDQVRYNGTPGGWCCYVRSEQLATYGVEDDFEVRFVIDTNPSTATWNVGIINWNATVGPGGVNHSIRNVEGRLKIYERNTWRTNGPQLAQGDVVSLYVNDGVIEYRHNDETVYVSNYSGTPDYQKVDLQFRPGPARISVNLIANELVPIPPSGHFPITSWTNRRGGVSRIGNTIEYSGSPTGWVNTINSTRLRELAMRNDFIASWTVGSDPATSIWVVGFGINEIRSNWRDIDYAFRNSNGFLTIHREGDFVEDVGPLAIGDLLSLRVNEGTLDFMVNGNIRDRHTVGSGNDFYIDTAFKEGPSVLSDFLITTGETEPPVPPPPPPPPPVGPLPIDNWSNQAGGVIANGNNITYSGSPTGWVNSINSQRLSELGADSTYSVSWVLDDDAAGTTWIVGFSETETDTSWRDIEYGMRSSNGALHIYEEGTWRTWANSSLQAGDELRIRVFHTGLEYERNGEIIHTSNIGSNRDFYIDTAFKSGAISLSEFTLWSE